MSNQTYSVMIGGDERVEVESYSLQRDALTYGNKTMQAKFAEAKAEHSAGNESGKAVG